MPRLDYWIGSHPYPGNHYDDPFADFPGCGNAAEGAVGASFTRGTGGGQGCKPINPTTAQMMAEVARCLERMREADNAQDG